MAIVTMPSTAAEQETAMAVLDCLARFNALPPDDAEQVLRACCASSVWAHDVSTLRPFTDVDTLYAAAAAAALARLTERDLDDALWPAIHASATASSTPCPCESRAVSRRHPRQRWTPWPRAIVSMRSGSDTSTWSAPPAAAPRNSWPGCVPGWTTTRRPSVECCATSWPRSTGSASPRS